MSPSDVVYIERRRGSYLIMSIYIYTINKCHTFVLKLFPIVYSLHILFYLNNLWLYFILSSGSFPALWVGSCCTSYLMTTGRRFQHGFMGRDYQVFSSYPQFSILSPGKRVISGKFISLNQLFDQYIVQFVYWEFRQLNMNVNLVSYKWFCFHFVNSS